MALTKRDGHYYGDSHADIRAEVERYSRLNGYPAQYFGCAICECGCDQFRLGLDDNQGAAVRVCDACSAEHPIADSDEYLSDASLESCACPCGGEVFEIMAGVSLYENTDAVKWLYLGCRCPSCGLTAVYGDWKNEFENYRQLLDRV